MKRTIATLLVGLSATAALLVPASPASALLDHYPITGRVSVDSAGKQVPSGSTVDWRVLVDTTGRRVAFTTDAALVPEDTNGKSDVYLRDRITDTTTLVSRTAAGQPIEGESHLCGLSRDGDYVGYESAALNLPGGTTAQIYVQDWQSGAMKLVSKSSAGVQAGAGGASDIAKETECPISYDGRYAVFETWSPTVVAPDVGGYTDVFWRDTKTGTTKRVSQSTAGVQASYHSGHASMSDDGKQVVFDTTAGNLVPGDDAGFADVFLRHTDTNVTERVSLKDNDAPVTYGNSNHPAIAGNGGFVAFQSDAKDLVADDDNQKQDVFVRGLAGGTTELVSLTSTEQAAQGSSEWPAISGDGRYVTFASTAANLYPDDPNATYDQFRRDRTMGTTDLASRTSALPAGNGYSGTQASISDDGMVVGFGSSAKDLVRNDTDETRDAFVRDFWLEVKPFGSFDALIKQQFVDYEGRSPTAGELAEWRARLVNGEYSPDHAIGAIGRASTWAAHRTPVVRLYWAFFLRMPDLNGLNYWVAKHDGGKSLALIAKDFAKSSEFQTKFGSLSNHDFVEVIYQNIFEREADAQGLAYWTKKLDEGSKTRGDVMVNFSESSEGKRFLAAPADVLTMFLGMLEHMPNPILFATYVDVLRTGDVRLEELIGTFRSNPSYGAVVTP